LLSEFQIKMDESNAANEARYSEGKGLLQGLYDRSMSALTNYGQTATSALNRSYGTLAGKLSQNMVSRGLTGSTIAPNMQMGVERQRQESLAGLNESINQQKLGVDANLTNALTGWIERRTDTAPSLNDYANLAMQLGQATGSANGQQAILDVLKGLSNVNVTQLA
jgi:hypothetical protein